MICHRTHQFQYFPTVSALCRLHNYCVDCNQATEPLLVRDDAQILVGQHITDEGSKTQGPSQLLGGGEHFDDMSRYARQQLECTVDTPRDRLLQQLIDADLHRPVRGANKKN